jgi:signal transduction histidine kinase
MIALTVAAAACAAAGLAAIATSPTPSITVEAWFGQPLVEGLALLLAGLAGWVKRPESRIGPFLCVAAVLSFAPYVQDSPVSVIASTGYVLREVWVAVLIGLVLSYPSGRPTTVERVVAGLALLKVLVPNVATALLVRLPPPLEHRNAFHLVSAPGIVATINRADTIAGYALGGAIAALVLARVVRGTRVARASALPVLAASGLTLLYFTFSDFTCVGLVPIWPSAADTAAHAAIPVAFLIALARGRVARARMGGLLIDIGEQPNGVALRDALARALGDSSLALAYWNTSQDHWISPSGEPIELPVDGAGRAVSFLERDGKAVAALIHDPALRDEPERLEPVRRAVRLLLDNERLSAETCSQLAEVRASRKRILEAADHARARVQRDLHDGAQQRLVGLALNMRLAQRAAAPETALLFDEVARELEAAIQELRELARGLHPSVLTESGLAVALSAAAGRCPVPVTLDVDIIEQRYPPAIEATAYYLVTEALTNIAKYAGATIAHITVFEANSSLWLEVRDDGAGGAEIGVGSGLSGLRDRVEAIGGTLLVESPPGAGTRLAAQLPVEGSAMDQSRALQQPPGRRAEASG